MEETKLGKYKILYTDSKEYHSIKREIWGEDIYYFDTGKENPFIIDIGAHIGVSILYFKSIYPNSKILAFEPNINSFNILKENILLNNLKDITAVNMAVWKSKGNLDFYIEDGSWSSNSSILKGGWTTEEKQRKISVQTDTLNSYIDKTIDMLKIDTEGSELSILKYHRDILQRVQNICLEYHPIKQSKPEDVLNILSKFFKIEIYSEGKLCKKPQRGKLLTIKGKKLV